MTAEEAIHYFQRDTLATVQVDFEESSKFGHISYTVAGPGQAKDYVVYGKSFIEAVKKAQYISSRTKELDKTQQFDGYWDEHAEGEIVLD